LGFHPKCPVCFRLRKKRRLTMTKSPRIDMIGDRTMVYINPAVFCNAAVFCT
jgi:hypothetical protein